MIRALVIDDEPLARDRICRLLARQSDIQVVGQCGDGKSAVIAIAKHDPDLVFLDVQMPELDGFGVLREIPRAKMPVIVFVSAYDQYAVKAFAVHALDYLLKPFDRERFTEALERARDELRKRCAGQFDPRIAELLKSLHGGQPQYLDRFVVKLNGRVYFVRAEDVDWIEAAGNYLKVHSGKDDHLVRETMNTIESKLDPKRFVRIHRSTIVHLDRIKEMRPWFHGEYSVILKDGKQLTLSRSYRDRLKDILGETA